MLSKNHRFQHCLSIVALSRPFLLRQRFRWAVVLVIALALTLAVSTTGASSHCATTNNSYVVAVCIEAPIDGATISGEQTVTAATSIAGSNPGIQKLIFYLDGAYLLTDFEADYSFTLPSGHFVDGVYTLEVEVVMRDGFVSDRADITVTLNNGVTSPPVNTNTFTPRTGNPANGQPFVVGATGDGASGRADAQAVTDLIASADPNMLLYLGDVYEDGTYTEFWNWYGTEDTFYGRFKDITNPTIGNHELTGGQAPGYFYYWDNVPDYYSVDTNGWHIINLNSNSYLAEFEPGTPQFDWLAQDLASTTAECVIVMAHHPVYSVGLQGDTPRLNSIWALLAQHKVDLFLAGHDHNYQRWQELDGLGQPTNKGTVQIVAGAGGQGVRPFVRPDARLVVGYDTAPEAFGSLFMTLNPAGLEFQYINIAQETLDSGVIPCNNAPNDKVDPTNPSNLTASTNSAGQVLLDWTAATDNTGVEGYTIFRNGQAVASVKGATTEYLDSSGQLNSDYTYTVQAFDPKGNTSGHSNETSVTTPSTGLLVLNPVADTYVNQDNPNTNYGSATTLRTDGSPDIRSYIRFDVQDVVGVIESATLRVFAQSSSGLGYRAHQVADNSWAELATTYDSAPAVGDSIGTSGAFSGGDWTEVDVTSAVNGEGLVSFALTGLSGTGISYLSRQGAMPPQLVIATSDPAPFAIGTNGKNTHPAITLDANGKVHVIFEEDTGLFYTNNAAGTFSDPVQIAADIAKNQQPDIAADANGGIHVVYSGKTGVYYMVAASGGSFSAPLNIGTANSNQTPALAVDASGLVHVVYEENGAILYTASSIMGFSSPVVIGTGFGPAARPDIATGAGGSVHVVFDVQTGLELANRDIYYTVAPSGGAFSSPLSVGTNVSNSAPAIDVDAAGDAYIVYEAAGAVHYTTGSNITFSPPETISLGIGNLAPDIAIDQNDDVHIVYQSANVIHYTNDHPGSFLPPAEIDTGNKDRLPALAVGGNGIYLAFEVQTLKNASDIYHARLGPLPGGTAAP